MALSKINTNSITDDAVTGAKVENNPTIAGNLSVSGGFVPSSAYQNRNMIINGDMSVAQRATSDTGVSSSGYKVCDRWSYIHSGDGTVDLSQSTTTPNEFKNSLKIECNAADSSLGASDVSGLRHYIEAQNCQRLAYGTSSAKSITLSFHVRSKQTGTYAVNIFQDDDTRHFTKTYTISSADTFEKKTITFVGDTTGVIEDDTGKGIEITWWLRAGSTFTGGSAMSGYEAFSNGDYAVGHAVDFLDNAANEFYITGVQLEIGDVATPFEYENFQENLLKCQRYFYKLGRFQASGYQSGTTSAIVSYFTPVRMRVNPSIVTTSSTTSISTQGEAHVNRTLTGHLLERRGTGNAIEHTHQVSGGFGGSDNRPIDLFNFFGDYKIDAELS